MVKTTIVFSDETRKRLADYITAKHGVRRMLSITVEEAVTEYLKSLLGR